LAKKQATDRKTRLGADFQAIEEACPQIYPQLLFMSSKTLEIVTI